MKRSFSFAAALALMCGASVFAQTTYPADPSNPAGTGVTPTTDPANRATQGTVPTTTMPPSATDQMHKSTTTAAPTTTSTTTGTTARATVTPGSVNLASFDTDNDGVLTPLEFGQLVMSVEAPASGGPLIAEAKRERYSKASGNGAIKLLNETADEFSRADQNHDKRISQDELAMWSGGGTAMMPTGGMMGMTPSTSTTAPMNDQPSTGTTTPDTTKETEDQTTPPRN